uniref:Ycii-related protein n=1 Tax=Tetraselmis sp. GSL018 TaxID=582737 RepID=A0A061S644_9CHLO
MMSLRLFSQRSAFGKPGLACARRSCKAFATSAQPPTYTLLTYEYVEDIVEKRGPYRQEHLAAAFKKQEEGKLVVGGPHIDPIDGAVFIWKDVTPAEIEQFVQDDPYVVNGLVPRWSIRQFLGVVS